jgi:hypothetical protein
MVFEKYFLKRFFKYTLALSMLLALIVSFVEFFEKIVHAKLTAMQTILKFIGINFIPSFFELSSIACWLASCLLIKEFYQQNEWESFALLNIDSKTLLRLAFIAGFSVAGISLVCRELFVEKMIFNTEQFKMENFKQKSAQKIVNKWVEISPNIFAHFSMLDFSTNSGNDLFILYVDADFSIQQVLSAPFFTFKPEKNLLLIPVGIKFEVESNLQEKFENKSLALPTFFSQIQINMEPMTLKNLLKNLLSHGVLPQFAQNSLRYQLVNKIAFYLKFMLYPVLTFALFIFFWHTIILKWVAILLPYPFFVGFSLLSDFLFSIGINPWLILLVYLLILAVTYAIFFTKFFKKRGF